MGTTSSPTRAASSTNGFDISRLTPAPSTTRISSLAAGAALILCLTIAVAGGTLQASGTSSVWFTVLGALAGAACLYVALRSVSQSVRSRQLQRDGDVLAARQASDRARHHALIALGLVTGVFIALGGLVLLTMNGGSVSKTFFRWDLMKESALDVVKAFGINIFMAVVAMVLVLAFGLLLAVARMLPGDAGRPIRALAIGYIDVFRAIPGIIVLYLVGFGLPLAGVPFLSSLSPVWFAIVALSLSYSAFVAEIFRSGIEQIHPSQASASRSLGFSYAQTLRYIVLPQAIRGVIPPLLSVFIALQKDTSLVNIIGAMDAFNQAKFYASNNFNLSSVTFVAIIFVVITIPQTRAVDWLLARDTKTRRGGTK